MILGEDNRKKWSPLDVLVMQAYEMFKGEQCQHCGYPTWICRVGDDDYIDPNVQVRKKIVKCWVDEEVDEWREATKDKAEAKFIRPEVYTRDGAELSTLRIPYYERLAALKAEEDSE